MISPIEGKRILLTRPEYQNSDWADRLKTLGAIAVMFPLIEITPVSNPEEIEDIVTQLKQFDWIIFTSANAARYSLEIINKVLPFQHKVVIAAIGSKTAAYLESHGIEVDFMPSIYTTVKLAEEMGDIRDKKILLPRTSIADDDLTERLTGKGATVREIIVYHTQKIVDKSQDLQRIFYQGIDVITFASPSAIEAFCDMKIHKRKAKIAVIGPVTADRASKLGLEPDIIAENYTTEGLTQAIVSYYETKQNLNTPTH